MVESLSHMILSWPTVPASVAPFLPSSFHIFFPLYKTYLIARYFKRNSFYAQIVGSAEHVSLRDSFNRSAYFQRMIKNPI